MSTADFLRHAVNQIAFALVLGLALVFSLAARAESPIDFWLAERARAESRPARIAALPAPRAGGAHVGSLLAACARNGVPYRVAQAIMTIESRGRCHATSRSGARGAMQVLPATARSVGVYGNLHDCATGIEAGMRYLKLVISTHGMGCGALGTYERGVYARPVCTAYGRKAVRLASLGG